MSSFNVTNTCNIPSDEFLATQNAYGYKADTYGSDCDMSDDEMFNSVITFK